MSIDSYKTPALYGLINSNRKPNEFWGKNQFNSAFPAALACWMRDQELKPVYIHLTNKEIKACDQKISFDDVFNSKQENKSLRFDFEVKYHEFQNYCFDSLEAIDLVVSENNAQSRPLEVKLTVLPDETTHSKNESLWGCELVVRPVSVIYAALTIYHSLISHKPDVLKIIRNAALQIDDWTNTTEILANRLGILDALDKLVETYSENQVPLVLQPIWKTKGKLPEFADQAFDIFVWSNMALCKLFLNQARSATESKRVTRHLRASARLLRCLYDLFSTGQMKRSVINSMGLGNQTDKEFSASGIVTNQYMKHPRIVTPKVGKNVLSEIILNGGERQLSPERRFDATIFFTATELFKQNQNL